MQAEHDDGDAFSNQPKGLTYDGEREVLARGGYDRHMDITQALMGPHEWGYRDPVEGGWIDDSTPFAAAELIAYLRDQVEKLEPARR